LYYIRIDLAALEDGLPSGLNPNHYRIESEKRASPDLFAAEFVYALPDGTTSSPDSNKDLNSETPNKPKVLPLKIVSL